MVYASYCASCHTTAFHTDAQFRFNWLGRSVLELFKVLRATMPEDNPGALSDDDYLRVIAYILQLNGYPPGPDSLVADTTRLRTIRFGEAQGHSAPAPNP